MISKIIYEEKMKNLLKQDIFTQVMYPTELSNILVFDSRKFFDQNNAACMF